MIASLLPAGVVAVESFTDVHGVVLPPEEEARVARAVDKRRREFTTARECARRALRELGRPVTVVPSGPKGEPVWPAGVVGSITHCDGYRAAVVARAETLPTVGIDAEPHGPLPEGVQDAIAVPAEHKWLAELLAERPTVCWDKLLFSAKESVYKAWYPLARRWLGFEDAELIFDPDAGTFTARLLVPGPTYAGREVTGFAGRWLVRDGLVL
ncbi:MAG TPA: 4'-phosphopantetheinyl transferase superfamily protein, partial [Micromonospora sp.]